MKHAAKACLATLIAAIAATSVASANEDPEDHTLRWSWSAEPVQGRKDEVDVVLKAGIEPGWILYSSDFEPIEFGPRPAKVVVDPEQGNASVGAPQAIGAARKSARNFTGEYSYTYFAETAEIRQRVRVKEGVKSLNGRISGQTCFESSGLCTLFKQEFSVPVP